jgi:hypothetical protein
MERELRTMTIQGELIYDTQAGISSAILELEAAYLYDGRDLVFHQDDGANTPHQLLSGNSLSGTRVRQFEFAPIGNGEYATARTFRIVVDAEYDISEKEVLEFRETLRFIGTTGPRWRAIEIAVGSPLVQVLSQNSVQRIYQQGFARGLSGYPIYPGPLFPAIEHGHLRQQEMIGPDQTRNFYKNFGIRWRYVYSAGSPQSGQPNFSHI